MRAITSQIILTSFGSRADGSLGFRGVTPELSSAEKVAFMDLQNKNCRALFEPSDYEVDAKVEVKGELSRKSQSERIRSVLFCVFKHLCETGQLKDTTYEAFYQTETDKLIEGFKKLLPTQPF